MSVSAWDDLTSLALVVRAADWFDEEERDYKLEIAASLKSALETARADGDWLGRLDSVFRADDYNLTNWRQNQWLLDWGHRSAQLSEVVAGFVDGGATAVDRFNTFAQLAETEKTAEGNAASVLAFGSLFNFAVEPESLPLVRARVFETVERRVGWTTADSASPTDRYAHHLAFAQEVRERMGAAGVPIRDMVDIQGVIFVLSQQAGDQLERLAASGHEAAVRAWAIGGKVDREESAPGDSDSRGISRENVLEAIRECRELGGDQFRAKYGYGRSLKYRLIYEGEPYDSKAIYGVAFGYAHPDKGPLRREDFTGGEWSVVRPLRKLGFEVEESEGRTNGAGGTQDPVMHLLMRWSVSREPNTIAHHTAVAAEHGAVWWGKLGDPGGRSAMSAVNLARIKNQLAAGIPTYLYLYRPGETWRARLDAVQTNRPDDERT